MIPVDIVKRMSEQPGRVDRDDADEAERHLRALGFRGDTEVVRFFRRYSAAGVMGTASSEELLDPASPTPQLEAVNAFVRDVYEVPARFVCLSSAEGEGFYLVDVNTGVVFDVGVEDLDELESGRIDPRWPSFFDFLRWYLG